LLGLISGDPSERDVGSNRTCDHLHRPGGVGREPRRLWNMGRIHARAVAPPNLRQVQRPVDGGMTPVRDIGGKDADLAVGDLARRPGVLARDTTRRFALLEEAQGPGALGGMTKWKAPHPVGAVPGERRS
jgi:hypothetical protein